MTGSLQSTPGSDVRVSFKEKLGKIWNFPDTSNCDDAISGEVLEAAGGSEILAKILHRRGVRTVDEIAAFLDENRYTPSGPMQLPDLDRALARVTRAIVEGERITVYGDYDVDGVTGTSVLYTVLKRLGAQVDYYIPHRTSEGYGLNLKAVSVLASKHRAKLIITCDCGVSNFAEINFAKSLGVETIVLDHHSMPDLLPPAVAIVHPKRLSEEHPLFHLPGVGVAYKFCEALLIDRGFPDEVEQLLDFVTLGMIADLVPLVKENRYLVKIGLPKLVNSERPGLKALLKQVRGEDTDLVGFGLAPRINAVGRLSDAKTAVELMTTESEEVAEQLAGQLQRENVRRQELCEKIFTEADHYVSTKLNLTRDRAIAIYHEGWHHGVVGIVASRLVEKYNRPVFLAEFDRTDGVVKGSARGVSGIDLYQVLKENETLMTRWGGHKMAAGFSCDADKASALCKAITLTCNRMLAGNPLRGRVDIDVSVESSLLSLDLASELNRLAPFGMDNKKPQVFVSQLTCIGTKALGKDGKHSRVVFKSQASQSPLEAVFWNSKGRVPEEGQLVDVVCTPSVNAFNGRDRLQLVLADWRMSGISEDEVCDHALDLPVLPEAAVVLPVVQQVMAQEPETSLVASTQSTLPSVPDVPEVSTALLAQSSRQLSVRLNFKDLRGHESPELILKKALEKFGEKIAIFAESCPKPPGVNFVDRTTLTRSEHLLIWQFPPTVKVFQQLIQQAQAKNVYLLAVEHPELDEGAAFLKRLFGLVKFAVNQRDGQVDGEKLASAMGSSKMAVALGLTVLKKVNLIDWFAEEGVLYLDLIGEPVGKAEDTPEYRQLVASLDAVKTFRHWCSSSSLKDIQLGLIPNSVELTAQAQAAPQSVNRGPDEQDRTEEEFFGSAN